MLRVIFTGLVLVDIVQFETYLMGKQRQRTNDGNINSCNVYITNQ